MRIAALATLLLTGCVSTEGQKVTVLLLTAEMPCEENEDGVRVAQLDLFEEDDFYMVEFRNGATGVSTILESTRVGTTATWRCPEDVPTLTARHATVLQARQDVPSGGLTAD